ncbi:hypothetical protein [Archangium violaceum]|uniref:hypothetical protein n=1 Tax=Archangium violaceum TaxID=83451 RepID=UPI0036DEE835
MSEKMDLATIDNLEITPLSDEELDSVAGGLTNNSTVASCQCCVAGATVQPPKELEPVLTR